MRLEHLLSGVYVRMLIFGFDANAFSFCFFLIFVRFPLFSFVYSIREKNKEAGQRRLPLAWMPPCFIESYSSVG